MRRPSLHSVQSEYMTLEVANVAVLGSTGSIGRNTLEVIAASGGSLRAVALSAHASLDMLLKQAQATTPRWIVASDRAAGAAFDWSRLPAGVELFLGSEGLERVASCAEVQVVV